MQPPVISRISKDGLSRFRNRIRVPLHQIISYAEIMAEDGELEKGSNLSVCLLDTIAACDSVLQISALPAHIEDLDAFAATLHTNRTEHCTKILSFSEQLQEIVSRDQFISLRLDVAKLHGSVRGFEAILNSFNTSSAHTFAPNTATQSGPSFLLDQEGTKKTSAASTNTHKYPINHGVILVVDDNEGNRDVLSRRLLRDGCEVKLADGGVQALKMARDHNFDLILLDIMMPDMDGIAVLAELKKDPQLCHLPVIMITAVDEMESVVRCIEIGADDYLLKPFNPTLLRARINALLERKRLRDEEVRKAAELEKALLEIDKQRAKTEELLLNILPPSIAHELQAYGAVQPMYFEDVTIGFADIVGFTLSTEELPADELVRLLHEYFTAFDHIMNRYGLEKLKTIGDCYMFAGGMPMRSSSHPVDMILAASEMIHTTQEMAGHGNIDWQLRIGVHTGPVIAGVVGIHKFAFDIWGDAVNLSSRMESSGAAGRVNLSFNTYTRVKDFFACEKRGRMKVKDGRQIEMYFVNSIASRFSENKNTLPEKAFAQRYRSYFRKELSDFPAFLVPSLR
jgi:adenylate cyclase